MSGRYTVAIRADASALMGSGHVMRCLALAESLRDRGERVVFVCRELPGDLAGVIVERDFAALRLSAAPAGSGPLAVSWERDLAETLEAIGGPVNRIVVDHYGIDELWERAARSRATRIAVVDDGPGRRHDCDTLVDQNLSATAAGYAGRVPETCERLLGPSFALIHSAAAVRRERAAARCRGRVRRVLVSFGGGDVAAHVLRVLEGIAGAPFAKLAFDIIIPESSPGRDAVTAAAAALENVTLAGRVSDMAERMVLADFMLGAGGVQALERCCLGLPSAIVTVAENQEAPARALADAGACWLLGSGREVGAGQWAEALRRAIEGPAELGVMSRAGMELVDGLGCGRVADAVLAGAPVGDLRHRVRPMTEADSATVWRWRNSEAVRRWMFSREEIAWDDHVRWFAEAGRTASKRLLVYESAGAPLGLVKFGDFEPGTGSCEWGFYIGDPAAPRGSGTRMGWLGLEYAFGELDLRRVGAEVIETNTRSLRFHDRLGFTRLAVSRRETPSGPVPVVNFELTRDDWRRISGRLRVEAFGA